MKIRYSVDDLKRSISGFAGKPSMILVLLRHTPNPSSKFIDLGVEIPCARGTLVKFESTLYSVLILVGEISKISVMNAPYRWCSTYRWSKIEDRNSLKLSQLSDL